MKPDNVHSRILKEAADALAPTLSILFEKCIEDGRIPSVWRVATITFICRKRSRHFPSSRRPNSLTYILYKVFERVIKEKMPEHLLLNNLMSRSQHGFFPGCSCITNILTLMDSLTQAYDDGQSSEAAFIDFLKAFDRVPRAFLVYQLKVHSFESELLILENLPVRTLLHR